MINLLTVTVMRPHAGKLTHDDIIFVMESADAIVFTHVTTLN